MKIKNVLCTNCKCVIAENDWYEDRLVCTEMSNPMWQTKYYNIRAELKTICPNCGAEATCVLKEEISMRELVERILFSK